MLTGRTSPGTFAAAENYKWTFHPGHNGVCYQISQVRIGQITDGTSKTYMVGEKAMEPNRYADGSDLGDNEFLLGGYNRDFHRSVAEGLQPVRDRNGQRTDRQFGSAHEAVWHMCFVDGAVHSIEYSMDPDIHHASGVRNHGPIVHDHDD